MLLPEARNILRLPFQQALHVRPWAIARPARPAGRIASLTLLKWHRLFLLSRTGTRVAQEKTRRGRPPRLRHNCKGYSFLPESRYMSRAFSSEVEVVTLNVKRNLCS